MPITQFQKWGAQANNIGAFWATGKLALMSQEERDDQLRAQYEELKSRGFFNE